MHYYHIIYSLDSIVQDLQDLLVINPSSDSQCGWAPWWAAMVLQVGIYSK